MQKTADAFKTAIQKTAEATGDLIGIKIADKITKTSKIFKNFTTEQFRNTSK